LNLNVVKIPSFLQNFLRNVEINLEKNQGKYVKNVMANELVSLVQFALGDSFDRITQLSCNLGCSIWPKELVAKWAEKKI